MGFMKDVIVRVFNQLIGPIKRSVLLMIGRGVLMAVDSSKDIQLIKLRLLADENKDKTEMMQHFGFTSNPPVNSDLVFLSIGGNRDHGVVIASESRQYRLKNVAPGDSAIYNQAGKYLWIKGNNIEGLVSKIKINNQNHELIAVLHEYMTAVKDGLVVTALGPMPWTPATKTQLENIIAKIETFKI
jgi:phage baseplate assembly protein V